MGWYNLSWLLKSKPQGSQVILYCNNPQCSSSIKEGPVAYDMERKEIYHPDGNCAKIAMAHRAFNSQTSEDTLFVSLDYISLEKALKLLRKGKLKQPGLQEKLD